MFRSTLVALALVAGSFVSVGQTKVFSDDFSSSTSAAWTTTGALGGWTVARSGSDIGARRNTSPSQLELTNDARVTTPMDDRQPHRLPSFQPNCKRLCTAHRFCDYGISKYVSCEQKSEC